jgi:hypothetical protein
VKLELVLTKELFQSGCELAPEDATQRGDGQEESSRGGDPSGTVRCKTASRNNVMDVRMMLKVLSSKCGSRQETRCLHPDASGHIRYL